MKSVNKSDSETRRCAFCKGLVVKREDGKWVCTKCHFWYDKLVEVKEKNK